MADSLIKWQRKDYLQLGKAVAEFNRKVKKLESEEGKLGLPEVIDYAEIKENIFTRQELNRQLNLLRSFKEEGAERLVQLNDETITLWESEKIKKEKAQAIRKINKQIKSIQESNFGMGSERLKTLQARKQAIKGFDKSIIGKYARTDFQVKQAMQYRENVIDQFDDLPEEFEEIKKHLLRIKNPMTFYKEMQKSRTLQEFFDWYKSPTSFGAFTSDEDVAETIIEELGI